MLYINLAYTFSLMYYVPRHDGIILFIHSLSDKVFEEAFLHYPDINGVKVDTKEIQVLTPRYQIKTLPGIMLFYRGNEIARFIGYKDSYEFQNFIEKYKR